jgi:nucleotide-binding universal stress UspA family protein
MDSFRNILAVYGDTPGSDDVLVQAVALARANAAKLTLVSPCGHVRSARVAEEARRRLTRIVPWMAQEGASCVTTDIIVGTPHAAIIRKVLDDDHDIVIVSAEAGGALTDVFLGNTATNLMLQCPCAVWVLKAGQPVPCSTIVAALNLCGDGSNGDALDTRILDLATSLARTRDACLHAVSFWDVDGREGETLRSEIRRKTRRQILNKHERIRREALNKLLAVHPKSHLVNEIHLPRGNHQLQLPAIVNRLGADVVVMGTACRRGLPRLLMGNFSETVLNGVQCSVLAVKPAGFRTPVASPLEQVPAKRALATAH